MPCLFLVFLLLCSSFFWFIYLNGRVLLRQLNSRREFTGKVSSPPFKVGTSLPVSGEPVPPPHVLSPAETNSTYQRLRHHELFLVSFGALVLLGEQSVHRYLPEPADYVLTNILNLTFFFNTASFEGNVKMAEEISASLWYHFPFVPLFLSLMRILVLLQGWRCRYTQLSPAWERKAGVCSAVSCRLSCSEWTI